MTTTTRSASATASVASARWRRWPCLPTVRAADDIVVVTTTIQAAVDSGRPGRHGRRAGGHLPRVGERHDARAHHPRPDRGGARRHRARLSDTASGCGAPTAAGSTGFTLEGLTVRGYERYGVQVSGVDHFRLTGTRYVDNPLYGLFPVRCTHGRVDHNTVSGSFDSGVYVGQCTDVLVDHNRAHGNTIGLEVELSQRVVVEDNVSTRNAIGAVVQISPGRAVTVTDDVVIRGTTSCRGTTSRTPWTPLTACSVVSPVGSGSSTSPGTAWTSSTTWCRETAARASASWASPPRSGLSTAGSTPLLTGARCAETSHTATGSTPTTASRPCPEPTSSGTSAGRRASRSCRARGPFPARLPGCASEGTARPDTASAVRRHPGALRARGFRVRAARQRDCVDAPAGDLSRTFGCCWVMQWMPPPRAKSGRASTPTTRRPG